MSNAVEYLLNTPLVRWRMQKTARTPEMVALQAKKQGLILSASNSINVERYSVLLNGTVLKTGQLDVIAWFLDKYASDPTFRG